jgi:PAS domain-containing protein
VSKSAARRTDPEIGPDNLPQSPSTRQQEGAPTTAVEATDDLLYICRDPCASGRFSGMDGPNAWLLTDRILVYNEVLLGRGSLDRLPIGVFVCNLSGAPLYANRAMREWLSLEPNLPAWAAFWQRFTGSDAPPAERGRLEPGDPV